MKKSRFLYIVPFVLSLVCALIFWFTPSYVREDGVLVEAFGFVPVGLGLFCIGAIALMIVEVKLKRKESK